MKLNPLSWLLIAIAVLLTAWNVFEYQRHHPYDLSGPNRTVLVSPTESELAIRWLRRNSWYLEREGFIIAGTTIILLMINWRDSQKT